MCITTDINAISLPISQLRQKAVSFSWDVLEQTILQVVSFYLENTQLELAEILSLSQEVMGSVSAS